MLWGWDSGSTSLTRAPRDVHAHVGQRNTCPVVLTDAYIVQRETCSSVPDYLSFYKTHIFVCSNDSLSRIAKCAYGASMLLFIYPIQAQWSWDMYRLPRQDG